MRRMLAAIAAILLCSAPAGAAIRATWTASVEANDPQSIHLNITRGSHHHFGRTFAISDLSGLAASQARSVATVPVQFNLDRAAGSFTFEGTFKGGLGAGQVTFTPDLSEAAAIRALGVPFTLDPKSSDEEILFDLATVDVSSAYIRSMQDAGYPKEDLEQYVAMRIFRVTPELVRDFGTLGLGKMPAEELVASQVHRVTPAYVREMREAGYPATTSEDLIAFRIHRVTPELVRQYRELGYDHLSADDLLAMSIHRVTPEFIRGVKAAGYSNVPVEKLLEMRIRRISPRDLNREQ